MLNLKIVLIITFGSFASGLVSLAEGLKADRMNRTSLMLTSCFMQKEKYISKCCHVSGAWVYLRFTLFDFIFKKRERDGIFCQLKEIHFS